MKGLVAIRGGRVVLPDVVVDGYVIISTVDGTIVGFGQGEPPSTEAVVDADGLIVMPGLIDLHCDAIEREIEPRPNTFFPFDMAFMEFEKRLAVSGITTMYHSISFGEGGGVRNCDRSIELLRLIQSRRDMATLADHRIHLRYEVLYFEGRHEVERLIAEGVLDYLSFMDHTPGQGQYTTNDDYKVWAKKVWGLDDEVAARFMEQINERHRAFNLIDLMDLTHMARAKGLTLASHDDDSREKIDELAALGVGVSEFPISLEAAHYIAEKGIKVCVGAPNLVRGGSHSGNMRAMDAVCEGCAHIVCSDYHPQAMLRAIMSVAGVTGDLPRAVAMGTSNAAAAVGIDGLTGSISIGKRADLILVEDKESHPCVRATFFRGRQVLQLDYIGVAGEF